MHAAIGKQLMGEIHALWIYPFPNRTCQKGGTRLSLNPSFAETMSTAFGCLAACGLPDRRTNPQFRIGLGFFNLCRVVGDNLINRGPNRARVGDLFHARASTISAGFTLGIDNLK